MCGRFTRHYTWAQVRDFLDLHLGAAVEIDPSYNVAPTQRTPVCRLDHHGQRELVSLRWGLVPAWSKSPSIAPVNARSETAATSAVFRSAFAARRCLVPISGFYEWAQRPEGKRPYWIRPAGETVFCVAGLWELAGGTEVDGAEAAGSFALLTTAANASMHGLHERMPVIVPRADHARWLDVTADSRALFDPAQVPAVEARPVSTRVGSPKINDATLIERVEPEIAAPGSESSATPANGPGNSRDDHAGGAKGPAPREPGLFD